MRRTLAVVALALALAACGERLPACPTEDSVSCHWDAATQGNGVGRSFDVDSEGTVTYLP